MFHGTLISHSMGSAQSHVLSELVGTVLTGLIIAGALIFFFRASHSPQNDETNVAIKNGKELNNEGLVGGATASELPAAVPSPQAVFLSSTIPGQFDVDSCQHVAQPSSAAGSITPKAKKPKRKKNTNPKGAAKIMSRPPEYHSESPVTQIVNKSNILRQLQIHLTLNPKVSSSGDLHVATISPDSDSSWTQVGCKRSRKSSALRPSGESKSEATSQNDESSPVRRIAKEDTDDLQQSMETPSSLNLENRKTLAEKFLPNPQRTGVEE